MWGDKYKSIRSTRGVRRNAPLVCSRPHCGVVLFLLAVIFGGQILRAEEIQVGRGDNFVWPGLRDNKELQSGRYNKPGEALFDSVHAFDALHYSLALGFTQSDYYSGSMTLRLEVVEPMLSQVRLHMAELVADSAAVGGVPAPFTRDDTSIVIGLNGSHPTGETLEVKVSYHDTLSGRGFYHFERNSYTMAEPQDARWWFPCFDEPWDKATSEIFATVPEEWEVGSNGYMAGVTHDPVGQTRTYHWVNPSPISTYLINLIMGDFAAWNDYYVTPVSDSIPIYNMVWREDSSAAAYDFATVPNMMRVFSELFYPYPFNKYGQGAVAPFFYGGMEHQTMTTMNRSWITGDRSVEGGYAHELAHMWWGDFVTMADWRHIWLNEGFATYASALYNEVAYGPTRFAEDLTSYQNTYFESDRNGERFPLFDPPQLFAVSEYVKGAWVLHMLRGLMGDSLFFAGLHQYAGQYAYSNASTWEFRDVMESVSGLELDWFFQEWIFEQGYPEYNYAWSYHMESDDFIVHLEIEQAQANAPIFRMPLKIRISAGADYDFIIQNDQRVQSYDFSVLFAPTGVTLDPDNWVLNRASEVTSINEPGETLLPEMIRFDKVYPNPFNSSVKIAFSVEGGSQPVELGVYDIQGRLIRWLHTGPLEPDSYLLSWDGRGSDGGEVSSGIYLLRLSAPSGTISQKVSYIR